MNKNLNIATIFANDPHMSNCIWVTSAVAEQFLRSKTMAARKTSRQILNKYAEDMKNGRWQITPDPIVFNSKGNLMKGVHRLTALIESGVEGMWLCVTHNCPDGLSHFDMGYRSTAAVNIKHAYATLDWVNNLTTAVGNFIHAVFPESLYKDNVDFAEYFDEFSDQFCTVEAQLRGAGWGLNRAFVRAAITLALIDGADKDLVEDLCKVLKDDGFHTRKRVADANFHELRSYVLARQMSKDNSFELRKELFMTVANVLKATEARKSVGQLDETWGKMAFPYNVYGIENNTVVYVYSPKDEKANNKTKKGKTKKTK